MQHLFPPPPATHSLCGVPVEEALKSTNMNQCTKCLSRTKEIEDYVRNSSKQAYSLGKPEVITVAALDMKGMIVKSIKQGASAGAMKVISNKLCKKLAKTWPMIMMVPEDMRHLMVCMALHMATNAAPENPTIKAAEAISAQAFEGILTATTAKMVSQIVETVSTTLEEIAAKNPELLGTAVDE